MDSGIYIILGIVGLIGAALPDNLTKENNEKTKPESPTSKQNEFDEDTDFGFGNK